MIGELRREAAAAILAAGQPTAEAAEAAGAAARITAEAGKHRGRAARDRREAARLHRRADEADRAAERYEAGIAAAMDHAETLAEVAAEADKRRRDAVLAFVDAAASTAGLRRSIYREHGCLAGGDSHALRYHYCGHCADAIAAASGDVTAAIAAA